MGLKSVGGVSIVDGSLDSLAAGVPFDIALTDAQRLGFAESDSSFDLSGRDAASKLRILARHASGIDLTDTEIEVVGITGVDHEQAIEARRTGEETRLVARCEQSGAGYAAAVGLFDCPAVTRSPRCGVRTTSSA